MGSFDAYAEWLQIVPRAGRPNHYELLGLRLFEDDAEHIRSRYWERFECVRKYEVGNFSEHALPLLEELSQAFQCLSDRESKRVYDAALRQERAGAATNAGLTETRSDAPRQAQLAAAMPAQPLLRAKPLQEFPALPTAKSRRSPARSTNSIPSPAAARPQTADSTPSDPGSGSRGLLIGGGLGAAAVLIFCVAMLTFGLKSDNAPKPANPNHAEPPAVAVSPSAAAEQQSETSQSVSTAGVTRDWSGVLHKVLAVREAANNDAGSGAVHLVIQVEDAEAGVSAIDAVVPNLAFLREIADYRSALDGGAAEKVIVSGVGTDAWRQDRRVFAGHRLPVVELRSLRKFDGSSPVLVGARRDFSLSTEVLELAAALRTLDEEVTCDAVVVDHSDSSHVLLQLKDIDRQTAVARSEIRGQASGSELTPGRQIEVTAKVTGESVRLQSGAETIEVMLLREARISILAEPPKLASGASSTPAEPRPSQASQGKAPAASNAAGPLQRIKAHSLTPTAVAWSPPGDLLATHASDEMRIWDPDTGARLQESADRDFADEIQWSPHGPWLFTSNSGRVGGVWGVARNALRPVVNDMQGEFSAVDWNRATGQAAFLRNGALWFVQPPGPTVPTARPRNFAISAFAFSPDGMQLALAVTGYANFQTRYGVVIAPFVEYLRGTFGRSNNTLQIEFPDAPRQMAFRDDHAAGVRRLAAYIDDQVYIYHIAPGAPAQEAVVNVGRYYQPADPEISWSADGRRLAYLENSQVHLTELPAGGGPGGSSLTSLPRGANAIAFAPDSVHLAIGQSANELLVWDCDAGREAARLKTPSMTTRLDWRFDAQRLAAVHRGGELTIWQITPSEKLAPGEAKTSPSNIGLLELYARTGAWQEFHEEFEQIDSDELSKDEKEVYNGVRTYVKNRVTAFMRRVAELKKANPRWERAAPHALGEYQYLLKEVLAMDPKHSQAKKNLNDSIKEAGEAEFTPQ